MGKTAFKGPVYGAKSLLWTFGPYSETRSSGGTTGLYTLTASRVVPPYEDWFITEANLTVSTNSSVAAGHAVYIKSEGGSTVGVTRDDGKASTVAQTVLTLLSAGGSTNWSTWATATPTPGEYEGVYVPAGSSLRIVSSGITLLGLMQLNVMGYIRYVSSTRAES